jgi:hypothetical protein
MLCKAVVSSAEIAQADSISGDNSFFFAAVRSGRWQYEDGRQPRAISAFQGGRAPDAGRTDGRTMIAGTVRRRLNYFSV